MGFLSCGLVLVPGRVLCTCTCQQMCHCWNSCAIDGVCLQSSGFPLVLYSAPAHPANLQGKEPLHIVCIMVIFILVSKRDHSGFIIAIKSIPVCGSWGFCCFGFGDVPSGSGMLTPLWCLVSVNSLWCQDPPRLPKHAHEPSKQLPWSFYFSSFLRIT